MATKKSWWPPSEAKLARWLVRAGHSVATYESVSRDYDVAGVFDYQPLTVKLDNLQTKTIENGFLAVVKGTRAENAGE